jgi:hypothetical protein
MNDCYFAKKDWRQCKDEVSFAEAAEDRLQPNRNTASQAPHRARSEL